MIWFSFSLFFTGWILSIEIKCSLFIGLFCPPGFLIKCTSSTDIAVYHTRLQSSGQHFPNSEDVHKFVCNSNWCVNYQWVRPGINDQLRPQTKDQSRTTLHNEFQHGKPFKVFTCFQEERLFFVIEGT